jgi:hypothetical protein
LGFIFFFISSIKPKIKNNAQNEKYSKKIIFLNRKKLKKTISNEINIPIPPAIDIGLS